MDRLTHTAGKSLHVLPQSGFVFGAATLLVWSCRGFLPSCTDRAQGCVVIFAAQVWTRRSPHGWWLLGAWLAPAPRPLHPRRPARGVPPPPTVGKGGGGRRLLWGLPTGYRRDVHPRRRRRTPAACRRALLASALPPPHRGCGADDPRVRAGRRPTDAAAVVAALRAAGGRWGRGTRHGAVDAGWAWGWGAPRRRGGGRWRRDVRRGRADEARRLGAAALGGRV